MRAGGEHLWVLVEVGTGLQYTWEWVLGERRIQVMRKGALGPFELNLEEFAHRTPEKASLLGSDHLSRGFRLTSARQVGSGEQRVSKQGP